MTTVNPFSSLSSISPRSQAKRSIHKRHLPLSTSLSAPQRFYCCRCCCYRKKGTLLIVMFLGSLAWIFLLINIIGNGQKYQQQAHHELQQPFSLDNNNNNNINWMNSLPWNHPTRRNDSSSFPTIKTRHQHNACDGYNGILHIASGDIGGAAGTIFFQFVVGQIIWAELYGFKPWVYLNNVSYIVYDNNVHGSNKNDGVEFDMMSNVPIEYIRRPHGVMKDAYPGAPLYNHSTTPLQKQHYHFPGNGVWESYFEPVSDFIPNHNNDDSSCRDKPLVTMDLYLITPGIHGFAPWSPKCWRYDYMPDYMTLPHIPLHQWLQPQRQRAHDIMNRYIKFKPYLHDMAQQVNPINTHHDNNDNNDQKNQKMEKCCGVHIRHSDKVGGRRKVAMTEFLPYLEAYVRAGGTCIYLATDSSIVLETAYHIWPLSIRSKLRSLGPHAIRSHNETAVFDMTSNHHRTNTEILVEILALSRCDFLLHGLSAVSETAIWIHYPTLHHQSVNLEDDDHQNVTEFEQLVRAVLQGEPALPPSAWREEQRQLDWWKQQQPSSSLLPTLPRDCPTLQSSSSNKLFLGILHIAHAGELAAAGTAFFTTLLQQLDYAERHDLLPWIHLGPSSQRIYDNIHHNVENHTIAFSMRRGNISLVQYTPDVNQPDQIFTCPGEPMALDSANDNVVERISLQGTGIWKNYFQPVSEFAPEHAATSECYQHLPLYRLKPSIVVPGLHSHCPGNIRAWRYDQVPASLWHNPSKHIQESLQDYMYPMRRRAHELVQKYYKFRPHVIARAKKVNPIGTSSSSSSSCLAVHIRQSDKEGLYRRKFPPHKFRDYMRAYVRAGGTAIYVATDSHRALEYMTHHFPPDVLQVMRTQGKYVVRSTKKWPVFELAEHHRTNSEALVDILAMSYCHILLHGHSAMSEAAIYLNLNLHNHSVNLEDPNHLSVAQFEKQSRSVLGASVTMPETTLVSGGEDPEESDISNPVVVAVDTLTDQFPDTGVVERPVVVRPLNSLAHSDSNNPTAIIRQGVANTTLLFRPTHQCRENAIVYLAQKRHSSYDRDSYGLLLHSLDLLVKNYLAKHSENVDVFIFHTGDFDEQDLKILGSRYANTSMIDMLRLVDLSDSMYWRLPPWHVNDNPNDWYAYHLFKLGYRHMMHWFAIGIWDFFANFNTETGCNYGMIMRFDEDSFLHSPIRYNVFDLMQSHGYVYGYRLCAYELQVTQRIWKLYRASRRRAVEPIRDIGLDMCGFYNNFFVASISFFRSNVVQIFLKLTDRKGYIYRRRLGDLMIHSMAVYAFAPPEKIHRFLDFTYEHITVNKTTGCVSWGGIQAGYNDDQASLTLETFYQNRIASRGCTANVTTMTVKDLSPTYSHLPDSTKDTISLKTIMVGNVELPNKGLLSG